MMAAVTLSLALLLIACSDPDAPALDAGGTDASGGGRDSGSTPDSGGPVDAGLDARASDAGTTPDAGTPILVIEGTCGVLDTEITDELPHYFANTSTFPEGFTTADLARVSEGARTILDEGTAGGSSGESEAFAFEVLHRCEGASLVRTETMIRYSVPMPGSITDILVEIGGERVGVSVTRALTFSGRCMSAETFDMAAATELIERKLAGVNESSTLVAPEDAWVKQILFVYAINEGHAAGVMDAWSRASAELRADTILYVSVSEGMDEFIYFEGCP
jgi:hypothetical protein